MANYQVIAREMKGASVTGYVLDNGNTKMRVDMEQMAFLVGRGMVENCEGRIFRDTLTIGGVNGLKLNKLPSIKSKEDAKGSYTVEDGEIGKEPEALYNVTGIVKRGRVTVAYDTDKQGEVTREQVIQDAVADKVGNLTTQMYNGKVLLRGVGINIKLLPVRTIDAAKENNKGSSDIIVEYRNKLVGLVIDEDIKFEVGDIIEDSDGEKEFQMYIDSSGKYAQLSMTYIISRDGDKTRITTPTLTKVAVKLGGLLERSIKDNSNQPIDNIVKVVVKRFIESYTEAANKKNG